MTRHNLPISCLCRCLRHSLLSPETRLSSPLRLLVYVICRHAPNKEIPKGPSFHAKTACFTLKCRKTAEMALRKLTETIKWREWHVRRRKT